MATAGFSPRSQVYDLASGRAAFELDCPCQDNRSLAYFLGGSRREKPDVYIAASPTAHVSPGDPVTQLIHGEGDLVVSIEGSRQLHQVQKSAGVDSRLKVMPKQGHALTFLNPETANTMVAFFEETLK